MKMTITKNLHHDPCKIVPQFQDAQDLPSIAPPKEFADALPKHFFVNKFDYSPNCNIFAHLNQKVYRLQSMPGWRNR